MNKETIYTKREIELGKQLHKLLAISRAGFIPAKLKKQIINLCSKEKRFLNISFKYRPIARFDKQLISILHNDFRVKKYLFARFIAEQNSSIYGLPTIPLEIEIGVIEALEDYINGKYFSLKPQEVKI